VSATPAGLSLSVKLAPGKPAEAAPAGRDWLRPHPHAALAGVGWMQADLQKPDQAGIDDVWPLVESSYQLAGGH
jgi:hypothetical protein